MSNQKLNWGEYPAGFTPFKHGKSCYSTNGDEVRFHSVGDVGAGWTNNVVPDVYGELLVEARKHGYKR